MASAKRNSTLPGTLCFLFRSLSPLMLRYERTDKFWPPLTLRRLTKEATLWYKKTINLNSIFGHVSTHERYSISPPGPGDSGVWPVEMGESRTDRYRKAAR